MFTVPAKSFFLTPKPLRYRPVEQGDWAAGVAVAGVPDEAEPVGEDVRGEQTAIRRLQLREALPWRAVPRGLGTQQAERWSRHRPASPTIAPVCHTFGDFTVRSSVLGIVALQYRGWKGMKHQDELSASVCVCSLFKRLPTLKCSWVALLPLLSTLCCFAVSGLKLIDACSCVMEEATWTYPETLQDVAKRRRSSFSGLIKWLRQSVVGFGAEQNTTIETKQRCETEA